MLLNFIEGKKCNCTQQFATELPFPLGEVSGRYMEFDRTGQDAMLAHALAIVNAMGTKAGTDQNLKTTLEKLCLEIMSERVGLWCNSPKNTKEQQKRFYKYTKYQPCNMNKHDN